MHIDFSCLTFDELTTEQLYQLMALRQEVFVVEQDCPYLDADGKDQASWHVLGYDVQQKLVAYARLLPKGISYESYASIGRVVNAASVRGEGVGRLLMQQSLTYLQSLCPGEAVKISAQVYLIKFYESFGFRINGPEYLEDDIPHIAMIRPA